jgi:alpha/beta superfamily hydrolase
MFIDSSIKSSSQKLFFDTLSRFFTIHGSADEIIPVEDAYEFAKLIPNHKLRVIEGANHCYTAHRKELSDAVVECITSNEV